MLINIMLSIYNIISCLDKNIVGTFSEVVLKVISIYIVRSLKLHDDNICCALHISFDDHDPFSISLGS